MKQNVFDSESRSDLSFTVQKEIEVIHREVEGGTKINCYLKGEPVRILGNTWTEGFGEETLRIRCTNGEPRCTSCNIDYTTDDGCPQAKLTPE